MTTHLTKFSKKYSRETGACVAWSLYPDKTYVQHTSDQSKVDCRRCAKIGGFAPAAKVVNQKSLDRANETFAAMGTVASDWKQADIKFHWEKMMLPGEVACPECGKLGFYERRKAPCYANLLPPCRGTGKVTGLVKRDVLVGVVQWPKGTVFDSRFRSERTDRYCCELCSKTLKSVFAGRVAVVGTSKDGKTHGMFVGEDCAKKFVPGFRQYPEVKHLQGRHNRILYKLEG